MDHEAAFTSVEYRAVVHALDLAMEAVISLGKTEAQAQDFLNDFVANHYCNVWRPMSTRT